MYFPPKMNAFSSKEHHVHPFIKWLCYKSLKVRYHVHHAVLCSFTYTCYIFVSAFITLSYVNYSWQRFFLWTWSSSILCRKHTNTYHFFNLSLRFSEQSYITQCHYHTLPHYHLPSKSVLWDGFPPLFHFLISDLSLHLTYLSKRFTNTLFQLISK